MSPLFIPAILITLLFFLSGFEKIYLFAKKTSKFANKMGLSLTLAKLVISCVIALELVAPAIIAAYMYTRAFSLVPFFKLAVIALSIFTILATLLYHNPFKGNEKYYAFMSNVSTLGGLMALYVSV
jgi:uncharacterized membrane protein YphA (DoxX/SURF4 family)